MSDYHASQAWAAGNRAARLNERAEALEAALRDAEAEIEEWRQAWQQAIREQIKGQSMTSLVVAVIDDPEHNFAYDGSEVEALVLNGWFINDAPPFDDVFIEDMNQHMDIIEEFLGEAWIEWINGAPEGEERRWSEDHSDDEPDTNRWLTTSQKFLLLDYYRVVERNLRITEEHYA